MRIKIWEKKKCCRNNEKRKLKLRRLLTNKNLNISRKKERNYNSGNYQNPKLKRNKLIWVCEYVDTEKKQM